MHSNFMSKTMTSINDSTANPKLRTFKLFKNEFKLEQYLSQSQNIMHTQALARFRISSHNLHIETGRYTQPKTPPEQRKCIYCNTDEVEDELHLVLNCPMYILERNELLHIIKPQISNYNHLTDTEKFTEIMTTKNPESLRAVSKFVYRCLDKRMTANP